MVIKVTFVGLRGVNHPCILDPPPASRLLRKCNENVSICVLKLVVPDCSLVSVNVATDVSLVNIRLLPFSTSDNIKCLRCILI